MLRFVQQVVTNYICNDGQKATQLDKRVTEPLPINYVTAWGGGNRETDLLHLWRLLPYNKFVPAPFTQISNFISQQQSDIMKLLLDNHESEVLLMILLSTKEYGISDS